MDPSKFEKQSNSPISSILFSCQISLEIYCRKESMETNAQLFRTPKMNKKSFILKLCWNSLLIIKFD